MNEQSVAVKQDDLRWDRDGDRDYDLQFSNIILVYHLVTMGHWTGEHFNACHQNGMNFIQTHCFSTWNG